MEKLLGVLWEDNEKVFDVNGYRCIKVNGKHVLLFSQRSKPSSYDIEYIGTFDSLNSTLAFGLIRHVTGAVKVASFY